MSVLASGACGLAYGRVLRYHAKCPAKQRRREGGGGKQNKSNTCEAHALSREERYASGANSASCQSTSEWGYFFFETTRRAAPQPRLLVVAPHARQRRLRFEEGRATPPPPPPTRQPLRPCADARRPALPSCRTCRSRVLGDGVVERGQFTGAAVALALQQRELHPDLGRGRACAGHLEQQPRVRAVSPFSHSSLATVSQASSLSGLANISRAGTRAAAGTVPAPPLLLGPHDPEHFGVRAACGRLPQQCRGPPARRACALS